LEDDEITIAAYDAMGRWIDGNMEHLHPLYKLLPCFCVLLARECRQNSDYNTMLLNFTESPAATKPKPNLNLRKAYQNIYSKYHININSYNSRFTQLLKARIPSREEHKLFGAGISSRYLADTKKRYWYRNDEDFGIPDMAVMLLIDGSGSMEGSRRESAMVSSVILHEVLKKQGVVHAIVEHRAIYE
jgi:hypothetical protein